MFLMIVQISINHCIENVNLRDVLISNYHFEHFAPIFVCGQNGSEGMVK